MYPSKEAQETLKKWLGTSRWTYNRCVQKVREMRKDPTWTSWAGRDVLAELRKHTVNKPALKDVTWAELVPEKVRDGACRDVWKAVQAGFGRMQRNEITGFEIKYRSKKQRQQSIVISYQLWNTNRGKGSFLHRMNSSEALPRWMESDCRLVRNVLNQYFICIPCWVKHVPFKNQDGVRDEQLHSTIALDPGVRTFMTGYDADGQIFEWGVKDKNRLFRLSLCESHLQSRAHKKGPKKGFKLPHRKRYHLKRAAARIRLRIRNLVEELHKKLIKWLCTSYRCILLPEFETSRMVRRSTRKINGKTVKMMYTWSHYKFRQRLQQRAELHPDCNLLIIGEAYTSKTCGACGSLKDNLGGNKLFNCPCCFHQFDRDYNGARNILLRYLTRARKGNVA